MSTDDILIPLIQSDCKIVNLSVNQFPILANISLESENLKLQTDIMIKEFPIIDILKQKKFKTLTIEVIIFKGPGEALDTSFNYVMLGHMYERSPNKENTFKVSFGGMLCEFTADVHLNEMDEIGMGLKININ
ncbi:hypothetical protein M153_13100019565 [Pseudoloma neurophilia]|uniref:Uncharacterized protein n=1 Tax=Pseudoloma neurophilia TaxID=146866 RepID=A0A0R0LZZ6_9MICR|nr:hypothetical protein M153_13100019565 [Pseudoloma neurophilia]